MKAPGDLLALCGPCVLLKAETKAGHQRLCHDHAAWSAEEIQHESRGTRPQTLEDTCNLARWSPVYCSAGSVGELSCILLYFFTPNYKHLKM